MTLLLNAALAPGFVAVRRCGTWEWTPLATGRSTRFIGAVVADLCGPAASWEQPVQITVVTGPGSSTNLRIACSYANGVALPTGAHLASLTTFDLAQLLLPTQPTVLAFPQPTARTVLARRARDGRWEAGDAPSVPPGAAVVGPEPIDVVLAPAHFEAALAAATLVEVLVPTYWNLPQVTAPHAASGASSRRRAP